MKEKIRTYAIDLGMDDAGFAAASEYDSPQGPKLDTVFPGVKSIVVMCVNEMSHVESPNPQIAMNGRLDVMESARSSTYKMARYLEKECGGRAMSVPLSYPLEISPQNPRSVADVSLRHAAVAAGLGSFGRHNLVIHPRLGPRVLFAAVLTDLEIPPDPPVNEDLCTHCNICADGCPGSALDTEGQTDFGKCLKVSQPYGLAKNVGFWMKWAGASEDERRQMLLTKDYFMMYQAGFIGFQYFCFKCYASCPLGQR